MNKNKIWSFLVHLGYNLYADPKECFTPEEAAKHNCAAHHLRFDMDTWHTLSDKLKESGCNTIVIDIAEGVIYDKHPEIAVKGSLTKAQLNDEVKRLKRMGFNVIPKINFAASHDIWMGKYSRMVSTPEYYRFCSDCIDEMCEVFENPSLFHIGMDEECFSVQDKYSLCVIRHGLLYWHDFNFFVSCVQKHGARAWAWADYVWHSNESRESFLKNCSKEVLLSNWYYHEFEETEGWLKNAYSAYDLLEKHGFDQIPGCGNHLCRNNLDLTVERSVKNFADERLKGFIMTTWLTTTPNNSKVLFESADVMGEVYNKYISGGYNGVKS